MENAKREGRGERERRKFSLSNRLLLSLSSVYNKKLDCEREREGRRKIEEGPQHYGTE
ncbi:uncharacterized protein G2W53_017043 [Senna tora]|uniref:Uncharacterized protein n=1 Tax=Senna tora TaxID=362788 RepID=A0A834TQJ6_9FABA|nr:uncharacterized protein G2W53_017043 [Senna tora]